jgi:hypothetical protein
MPRGRIALAADASDDIGLVSANFEFIVSSGEGETFKFKLRNARCDPAVWRNSN